MAMKMQTLILVALLDRPQDIFADESQSEFWHLTDKLFQEPNPILSDSERESINAMISALQNARGGRAKQRIIENRQHPAGYAALLKWHVAYKFNPDIYSRVQKALEEEELSPHALIWSRKHKLDEFPPRSDSDGAVDPIACAIFGENCLANARVVGEFKEAVIYLIHHEWERQRKRYIRAMKTLCNKKLTAQSAFDDVEKELPTSSEVRAAIRALKTYKDAIYWFPKEEDAEGGIREMMGGLEAMLQTAIKASRKLPPGRDLLSEEPTTEPQTSGCQLSGFNSPSWLTVTSLAELRGKRRMAHIKGIAAVAAGDIEEIWATYVQLFGLKVVSDGNLQIVLNSEVGVQEAWQGLPDLGLQNGGFNAKNESVMQGFHEPSAMAETLRSLNCPGELDIHGSPWPESIGREVDKQRPLRNDVMTELANSTEADAAYCRPTFGPDKPGIGQAAPQRPVDKPPAFCHQNEDEAEEVIFQGFLEPSPSSNPPRPLHSKRVYSDAVQGDKNLGDDRAEEPPREFLRTGWGGLELACPPKAGRNGKAGSRV